MPVEGPLPQTGDQQDIGADADRAFRARMPRDWRPHGLEGTDDYGLDYQIQTTPGQRATDVFRVQLKGTRSPDRSADGQFISIQLKASTIRYYDRMVEPTLLVVCDLSADVDPVDCPLYYAWLRDELRRISVSRLDPSQKYVTLRVPISNRLRSSTDIGKDIDAQNELSRAGHALGMGVEQVHPGMRVEERVGVVQKIASGFAARSASFFDALAARPEQHWISPAQGSLAWHLKEADRLLKTGMLPKAAVELDAAEAQLNGATPLELGDYWHLRGKWNTANGSDEMASDSFRKAFEANPLGKFVAARVESELRLRNAEKGPALYPDLLELLQGDDPFVLSAKSRVLAAEGKQVESIAMADLIHGPERYAARALAHTMFSKTAEALEDCGLGIANVDLPEHSRQILLLLRARAKFLLSQASVGAAVPSLETLPPSGLAGINPALVKDAWDAIQEAVDALRDSGWNSNIDHMADIWCATASILGRQREILPELAAVARQRPHLKNLQGALESVAAQCGDFTLALEANDRMPTSDTRELRRTILLHEAQKHRDCFRWFEKHFDSFDRSHALFGPAAMVAAISAHRLSEPERVKKWSEELESHPHLAEHAALLQYSIAIELNKIGNEAALEGLIERFEALGRPFTLAVALLQELNPVIETQAKLCVQMSERIREKVEPSPAMASHVGMAMVTTKSWSGLLAWCQEFKMRVDAGPRMRAFEALALDKLGRTSEAKDILEEMLAGGVRDSIALNTHVLIMARCGYLQEAIDAAERIMEAASSNRQKMDCIRLLFNLIQQSDATSPRLLALAVQMGRLADSNQEVEEGIYLVMFLTSTMGEKSAPAKADVAEFQARAEGFFAKFPDSKIIMRGELRKDSSSEDLLAQLRSIVGFSEDHETFKLRLENQMQRGLTIVPFSWRPKFVLSGVHDVAHLWEIAKASSPDDKKYHLTMLMDTNWKPPGKAFLLERAPLLDLTALLVLFDLDLIGKAIQFFGKVAIAKATLEKLSTLVNPFSGSPMSSKCAALQNALKPHLSSIIQPSVPDIEDIDDGDSGLEVNESNVDGKRDHALGREHLEISRLCQQADTFRLYSDDLPFRMLAARSDNPDGLCTLDVLSGLEEAGLLTRQEVAQKVSMLCRWRVGIVVRFEEMASLLPDELAKASSVGQGMDILDHQLDFMAVANALWDFRARFDKTMEHAAAVARQLADQTNLPDVALAALLGQWFFKARLKDDAPADALGALTKAITRAIVIGTPSKAVAKKLWSVYTQLVEAHHGSHMDEQKEKEAIRLLGAECAKLYATSASLGDSAHATLRLGLTEGTSDDALFVAGYSDMLQRLANQSRQARRLSGQPQ